MTTTPNDPMPGDDQADPHSNDDGRPPPHEGAPGAEIGLSDGEGSTFEPEEDAEGQR